MWHWWPIELLTFGAPLWSQGALRTQCRRGLQALGLGRRIKWSAEWHYLGYRNAIHGGRSAAHHLHHGSPLRERSLVALSRSKLCDYRAPRRDEPSVMTDLLILFRPDLASIGFDTPRKNLSGTYIAHRLHELGGPIDRSAFRPYAIHSAPREAKSKSSPVFRRIAEAKGFKGNWNKPTITALALEAGQRHPPELRRIYASMAARLRRAQEAGPRLDQEEGVCATKLMNLFLADG